MTSARYDLGYEIAGHDFYTWLVMAVAKGATRVVFGTRRVKETKWTAEHVLERFRSIIEPGPALAGIKYSIGYGGETNFSSPHMKDLVKFCKTSKIHRLKTVLEPENLGSYYTVTIRNEPRILDMNSDQAAWRKFAREIGAVVVEDNYDVPMELHKKVAIYAGAKMNFGVVNGPMHLLTLTEYPVTIFKANVSAPNLAKHSVPFGTTPKWFRENQKLIWEDDRYDNLMREFEKQQTQIRFSA